MTTGDNKTKKAKDFEEAAGAKRSGFLSEMKYFLKTSKKWWLTPIVIALVLVTGLVILGGTAAAPFIYTLF